MSPTQIKLAMSGVLALIAWWLTTKQTGPRVKKELEIEANVLNPNFGLTDAEIAARGENPALDPRMRELIDESNYWIRIDDLEDTQ